MTLMQQIDAERAAAREALRQRVRDELRSALTELEAFPAVVFGSLAKPGRFHEASDVDLALEKLPGDWSLYGLTAALAERLGRRTDVVLLGETRLRNKIEQEGERWTA